ncbi:FkbM family methyltransferase [Bradyrhizobium sp. Arg62]|uniref:FkbM family methyltransferase n=1 Tax=Bradyrhizobium brasilense TaxID=1419277 RepID=UPI001E2A7828|nr:FkbM family methyltransferase [Bradyrhizobium brasilense]MCC8946001.1 FkbM family methyltransferase [Bradyrhizobium brasilense]
MQQFDGWHLPDGETHLVEWMTKVGKIVNGRYSYQYSKLEAALPLVKNWRCAIDVGGHVGLWTFHLAGMFQTVEAFEPVAAHRECFAKNITSPNVSLHACALGAREGTVFLHTGPSSSGDTYISDAGEHAAPMKVMDDFGFTDVDFIKLDCEGYELFALRGGENTIREQKPCIIVEQKPGKGRQFGLGDQDAVTLLKSWGAEVVKEISGDFICCWR